MDELPPVIKIGRGAEEEEHCDRLSYRGKVDNAAKGQ